MRRLFLLVLVLLLALSPLSASAQSWVEVASYTFDSTVQGWTGNVSYSSGTLRITNGGGAAGASPTLSKSAGQSVRFSWSVTGSTSFDARIGSWCSTSFSSPGSHTLTCDHASLLAATSFQVYFITSSSTAAINVDNILVEVSDTDPPTPTNTPVPTETFTPVPTNTDVPTNTPVPATETPLPTETFTPVPATETPLPTETFTPVPTNTDVPTNTPIPIVPTWTPGPTSTPVTVTVGTVVPTPTLGPTSVPITATVGTVVPTPTLGPTSVPITGTGTIQLGIDRADVVASSNLFFAGFGSLLALILGLAVGRRVFAYIKGLVR
jgi:hypothetical protein